MSRRDREDLDILSPSTKTRKPNHLRTLTVEGFECDDGTLELELRLVDQKRFGFVDRERGTLEAGDPVHGINARVSISQGLEVLDIETDLEFMPFTYCQGGAANIPQLIGKRLDKGWRRTVLEALGSTHGCTHLAELLCLAPTVAFQTRAITRTDADRAIGRDDALQTEPPFYIGGCYSWASDSPVTRTYFPQFDSDNTETGGENDR